MLKYLDAFVAFEEIPEKISLAINITHCNNNCIGCHSPELRQNIGIELNEESLDSLISQNDGINCVAFMGEGRDKKALLDLASYVKEKYSNIATAVYSGRENVENEYFKVFDYVKIGPYKAEFGPLNKETTNQRLYKVENGNITDITYQFWKRW